MTYIHLWLIHTDVWQKSNRYCTAIMLQKKKTQQGSQEGMRKSFLTEIYNHNSVYIWEQAAQNHQDFPPASDVPPQHQALVQHQTFPQHQSLVQHQALLQRQTLPQHQALV